MENRLRVFRELAKIHVNPENHSTLAAQKERNRGLKEQNRGRKQHNKAVRPDINRGKGLRDGAKAEIRLELDKLA